MLIQSYRGHVRQMAVFLLAVEAVAYEESVGDYKAEIIYGEILRLGKFLAKENAQLETGGVPGAQVFEKILERQTRVEYVFDDENMLALYRQGEVRCYLHLAGRLRERTVR